MNDDHTQCRYSTQRDCQNLLERGCHTSGVYTVQPDNMDPFEVVSLFKFFWP